MLTSTQFSQLCFSLISTRYHGGLFQPRDLRWTAEQLYCVL